MTPYILIVCAAAFFCEPFDHAEHLTKAQCMRYAKEPLKQGLMVRCVKAKDFDILKE